jgi:hypothetical protein
MNDLIQSTVQEAITQVGENSDLITTIKVFIEDKFGSAGLIVVALLLVGIAGLLLSKITKLSFDLIKYVAIPSVAVTFIATYFLPFSFVYILPVTVAFFSIVLMVKG